MILKLIPVLCQGGKDFVGQQQQRSGGPLALPGGGPEHCRRGRYGGPDRLVATLLVTTQLPQLRFAARLPLRADRDAATT